MRPDTTQPSVPFWPRSDSPAWPTDVVLLCWFSVMLVLCLYVCIIVFFSSRLWRLFVIVFVTKTINEINQMNNSIFRCKIIHSHVDSTAELYSIEHRQPRQTVRQTKFCAQKHHLQLDGWHWNQDLPKRTNKKPAKCLPIIYRQQTLIKDIIWSTRD